MRANATFMANLRHGLDENRVERALEEGLVTTRQAANALKFIRAAKAIRDNPIRGMVVQVEGRLVGEIDFDGTVWVGRRFGKDFAKGCAFASEAEAHEYVVGGVEKMKDTLVALSHYGSVD